MKWLHTMADARAWRAGCLAASVCVFATAFNGPELLARYVSPDGQITELTYVHGFQVACAGLGGALIAIALAAPVQIITNLAAAAIGCGIVFGGLEGSFRAVEAFTRRSEPTSPTGLRRSDYPGLSYENTPSFYETGELKFNSLGMRDDERGLRAERPTIVVVGDSIEAWRDLPAQDLYPRTLEALLQRQSAEPVQVVNLGVTGYSLHQKVLMLQHRGLAWNPRLVVVGYCLNDPIPAWELVNYFTDRPPHRPLRTVEFVTNRVKGALHQYGVDFYNEIHTVGSEEWKGIEKDLEMLGHLQRANGVRVVLVVFPLMVDTTVDYPWRGIHERVGHAAAQNGLAVVDLLQAYQDRGFAAVRADTVHPNKVGHRIAAEQLDAAIARMAKGQHVARQHEERRAGSDD